MKRKILAVLVTVCILLSVMPMSAAMAAEQPTDAATIKVEELRKARVDEYAETIVKAIRTKDGDIIRINADVEQAEFADLLAEKCYKMGAKGVKIMFSNKNMDDLQAKYLKDEEYDGYYYEEALSSYTMSEFPRHKHIYILSQYFGEDPATLEEQTNYNKTVEEKNAEFMKEHNLLAEGASMNNDRPKVAAAYPTKSWAKKIYPELSDEAAFNKMMDDLLDFARIGKGEGFYKHAENMTDLAKKANDMNIVELHYKSKTADLRVPLHKNSIFSAALIKADGWEDDFYVNIPTEEIFAMPAKYGANGTVAATRPIVLNGQLIEGLKMTFKDGKLVDYSVSEGADAFEKFFKAKTEDVYLGEAAIVSKDSPIFQTGNTYYHILLDENSGAHIALGHALDMYNLKPGAKVDEDVNQAKYHQDITIGSEDLTVTATLKDGSKVDILKNGEWNF